MDRPQRMWATATPPSPSPPRHGTNRERNSQHHPPPKKKYSSGGSTKKHRRSATGLGATRRTGRPRAPADRLWRGE